MYIGLLFVSKYNFAMYCPITPRHRSCNPLKNKIMHTKDGQPSIEL